MKFITGMRMDSNTDAEGDKDKLSVSSSVKGRVTIRLLLRCQTHVSLRLYDADGRLVQVIAQARFLAGWSDIAWYTGNLVSGIYLVSLKTENSHYLKKVKVM